MIAHHRLDEVCDITMGQAPSGEAYNDNCEGWPLIAGAGDFGSIYPEPKKHTTEVSRLSKHGDIVIGIRATIGEKVIADGEYCLGRGVSGLRPKHDLDSRYLWHWLTNIKPILAAKGKGATFKQVNKEDIGELQISLPPLPEQRRIAAILDQADALRAKRREALAELDQLTQSIFIEMFGDPQLHIDSGNTEELANVVAAGRIVTYGIVQAGPEVEDGVPYIKTGDIKNGVILEHQLARTSHDIAESYRRSSVVSGDIVMSIRATVGTTALVQPSLDGANLTQGTARISPGSRTQNLYLLSYLRTNSVQRWIQSQVKGATFREITLGKLRELPVYVPPLGLQDDFEARVNRLKSLEATLWQNLNELDSLFSSLQHRAFRGEL